MSIGIRTLISCSGSTPWRLRRVALLSLPAAVLLCFPEPLAAAAACAPPEEGEPVHIDAECVDSYLDNPVCQGPELRTDPVPHYHVMCEFAGTDARFAMSYPMAERYQGRFFQNTHPLYSDPVVIPDEEIAFGVASGAYYVRTNMGGSEQSRAPEDTLEPGFDAALGGYRVNAAAAKHSEVVAKFLYGNHDPYGYLYGGSGGAYQSVCSAEHTSGVWDGVIPYVMGSPHAIPNMFTVRVNALRILKQRDKFPEIMDAIDPGGSGDPYATLNEEEAAALREATLMGFPPEGWWNHETLNGGPLRLVAGYVPLLDPDYAEDFFNEPGYLGFDDPYGTVATARVQQEEGEHSVVAVNTPAEGLISIEALPPGDLLGAEVYIDSGAAAGQVGTVLAVVPFLNAVYVLGVDLSSVAIDDTLHFDNSAYLALQTYHRHQVPDSEAFIGWNQFRDDSGEPIYPQRDLLIGPIGAFNGAGCLPTGEFNQPMIVVENMLDIDALPWSADWYRSKVEEAQGAAAGNRFRLYFTEHAQHTSPSPDDTAAFARTIAYRSVLQHTLRDLADWVENGRKPPASTNYRVVDSQIVLPKNAGPRKGMQPVVQLSVNGGERADIVVGQEVKFTVKLQSPPRAGTIHGVEWDFYGVGDFPLQSELDGNRRSVVLDMTHRYDEPGVYFPVVRATQLRKHDRDDGFAQAQNLGRVRVVVTED